MECLYHPALNFLTGQHNLSFCRSTCVNPWTLQKKKVAIGFGGNTAVSYAPHIPSHPFFTTILTALFFHFSFCQTHALQLKNSGILK